MTISNNLDMNRVHIHLSETYTGRLSVTMTYKDTSVRTLGKKYNEVFYRCLNRLKARVALKEKIGI